MKIVSISDRFIDKQSMLNGLKPLEKYATSIIDIEWKTQSLEELQKINLIIEQNGAESYDVPAYIIEAIKDADIIITHFCPINQALIKQAKNLKIVGILRAGFENINIDFLTKSGILVVNTPGRNADSVADFTVGMMIAECRNIGRGHHRLKLGKWDKNFPNSGNIPELRDRIVGIVGFGAIGKKVAERLRGFNMKIWVYDPYFSSFPDWVKACTLDELIASADFVTLHLRCSESTKDLFNRKLLKKMKPTAYLINTARSGLINEKDLIDVLSEDGIAGAALDVFDKEPPGIDHPLVKLENVTLAPHMAGGADDAFKNSPKLIAENLKSFWIKDKDPKNIVNQSIFDKHKNQFLF